jgi:hypothetical protein
MVAGARFARVEPDEVGLGRRAALDDRSEVIDFPPPTSDHEQGIVQLTAREEPLGHRQRLGAVIGEGHLHAHVFGGGGERLRASERHGEAGYAIEGFAVQVASRAEAGIASTAKATAARRRSQLWSEPSKTVGRDRYLRRDPRSGKAAVSSALH